MVTYYEDDYGRFSYSIGEGVLERTCGPLFLDQLLHGDDLQYAIYRKERGEYAEPRPKDDTFTYEHTHQDGKIKEKTVKLYQGHASVNYSFVSIGKDDIWHGCGQCSGCRKSGKWGKEFTEALNNYLSTKEGETLGVAKNGGEEGRADDGTRPST
ncbi:hypothetical protein I302_105787 [Kwoniella bestiolae CBS 10118]|uniref:Uncharacterized protein n=1 Tax=Kwoniella bestiolae CBS 10118 TaxID=1296100 RepID=A0A1B9G276_9TREE|nr:hypothetical protein I302_04908 [Kwoniella bestiolae CBS 10118]OCF25098.1 hypothetical protein I302_04908 [Kwoniella bestiolae CBS 10118]